MHAVTMIHPRGLTGRSSVILVLCFLGAAAPADAVLRTVPHDYATIQGAMNAAADGDTVVVGPGTYTGEDNRNLDSGGWALSDHVDRRCRADHHRL